MGLLLGGSDWVKSSVNYVRTSVNHSISYWLRLDSTATTRRPFGNTGAWEARTSGTTLTSDYLQSGTLGTVTLTVGTYHHIVFVQNVTGTSRLAYRDGALTQTLTGSSFSGTQTAVMSIGVTPGGATQGWFGAIDDIRVYERVLTLEEIQTLYTCRGTDGLIEGLSIWYPMNEGPEGGSVSTIYEHTGNGPDCGVVTGSPVYNYDAGIRYRRMA